jgi:hypothetical protein
VDAHEATPGGVAHGRVARRNAAGSTWAVTRPGARVLLAGGVLETMSVALPLIGSQRERCDAHLTRDRQAGIPAVSQHPKNAGFLPRFAVWEYPS